MMIDASDSLVNRGDTLPDLMGRRRRSIALGCVLMLGAGAVHAAGDLGVVSQPGSLGLEHHMAVLASAFLVLLVSVFLGILLVQHRRLRRAEASGRESEQRFRVLMESAPEAIVVYDAAKDCFVDANSKAERLFACGREELLKGSPERFHTDEEVGGTLRRDAQRALAGETMVAERKVRALDGRCFPCEVSLVRLPSPSGTLLRGRYLDLSERKHAEQERGRQRDTLDTQVAERTALSIALRDAQAASRAKSVFLANLSHELRTPLNSIIGFSQIMSESTSMFDDEKRNLGIINRAGHLLLGMINDVVELSKIEAGQARCVSVSTDIAAMLREVHALISRSAECKGVSLVIDCPERLPGLLLDAGKLRQVLVNLLSTAVRLTESGGISLTVSVVPGEQGAVQLAFSVAGLRPAGDPAMQSAPPGNHPGAGLSLKISRELIHVQGGTTQPGSALGGDSSFNFAVPAQLDPANGPAFTATSAPLAPGAAQPAGQGATGAMDSHELLALPGGLRSALRSALQQLDMRRIDSLMGGLRAEQADLARAIDAMLAAHHYRQLYEMLDLADHSEID